MRFDNGRLRRQSRQRLRLVALHGLEELPLLPADVAMQTCSDLAHEVRVARRRLRIARATLRQTPQDAVLVKQPVPQRRRMDQREQQPLLIIEMRSDLRTPRVQKPGDRANATRTILVRGLLHVPGLDQPAHVLARQGLERRVTLQRRGWWRRLLGAVVRHRVIVFSMCAPPTLNILGHAPGHGFDEPIGLLTDCHRRIEMFLEVLQRAAREYGDKPLDTKAADAVRTAQRYFAHAAPKHTADEEESLFPRMKAAAARGGTHGKGCDALARLEGDHAHADRLHARVDVLLEAWLRDGSLPPGPAAEVAALLDTLLELYRGHIHTEEAEVFPLACTLLTTSELTAVGEEMRARRGLGRAGT